MLVTRRSFLKTTAGALALAATGSLRRAASAAPGARRPNVLLILADDMGFSDAKCYGGDIRTPNLSALAAGGLRFTQHYSTGRCWPSRATILSGFYAQSIRRDAMPGIKLGRRPAWAPLLPEMLKPLGYSCYHSGKWHIDGPPADGGFDRSWGGQRSGCDWDRYFDSKPWTEEGVTAPVEPGRPYYSTVAIADHAIGCLDLHAKNHPGKPFFQYVAFYSPHFPLHAMQKDIDRYRDAYLKGWDWVRQSRWRRMKKMGIVNTPLSKRQPDIVPSWNLKPEQLKKRIGPGEAAFAVAWDSLSEQQKEFQAAKMAVHAAMITRMDLEIGRIVARIKEMGQFENTLILFASDNGASAEQIIRGDGHDPGAPIGSAKTFLCLGPGFSTAANTPLRLHKHWNHEGGISSPLIVHWPARISARGELRHNPSHFVDIAPTILEIAGGTWPDEVKGAKVPARPGRSLVPVFERDHTVAHDCLWWCHAGNRAIRIGDWKLVSRSGRDRQWELYDLSTDRAEMNDLAEKHPEKAALMARKWNSLADDFRERLAASAAPG
ncbi:MAG: arylsulfatase [Phycisphaerales bacterium]|nr:MAG: arylsulfatase [Phycisphaerales bacterium]